MPMDDGDHAEFFFLHRQKSPFLCTWECVTSHMTHEYGSMVSKKSVGLVAGLMFSSITITINYNLVCMKTS